MQRKQCRQASLPLPELVLTLLPPIWSHGRCFGGGPEQNRPRCRAELGEFAARFGLAAWLLRTHERDGRALPGCARDRNRRRTRPVGNRIRVSVRVVQDGEVVDVADTQVPTCGRQAGPHLVAWAPAHPRPFVAPRSCRTVVRICLGRACDQAETGYRDATRYQGTGDDERQAVRDVHAVRLVCCRALGYARPLAKIPVSAPPVTARITGRVGRHAHTPSPGRVGPTIAPAGGNRLRSSQYRVSGASDHRQWRRRGRRRCR